MREGEEGLLKMIRLPSLGVCTGCAACHDRCANDAITMRMDSEGFLYPQIDGNRCTHCAQCRRVCPALNGAASRLPRAVLAVKAKDVELRLASSSGGVFSVLARLILDSGGRVYGAAFDRSDWSVEHRCADDEISLGGLRGSKYVQSRMVGVYRSVEADVNAGIPVLFSGTHCQVAALRRFLGRTPENLWTVDVLCHGVPSPRAWQSYLDCRRKAVGRNGIEKVSFRSKVNGWKDFSLVIRFEQGGDYRCDFRADPFMRAFLSEVCNRPSCHRCKFRELRSGADLTVADFWGVDEAVPDFDDGRGVSLVLVNTLRGQVLFGRVAVQLDGQESTYRAAQVGNSALWRSPQSHPRRAKFLKLLACGMPFDVALEYVLRPPMSRRLMAFIRRMVCRDGGRR